MPIPIGNATYPSSISIDPAGRMAYVGIDGYSGTSAIAVINLTSNRLAGAFRKRNVTSGIIMR